MVQDPQRGLHIGDLVALILVIVGGLNWGLMGVANYNVVEAIFGTTAFTAFIYVVVGLAAIWCAFRSPVLAHLRRELPAREPPPAPTA